MVLCIFVVAKDLGGGCVGQKIHTTSDYIEDKIFISRSR